MITKTRVQVQSDDNDARVQVQSDDNDARVQVQSDDNEDTCSGTK